MLRVNSQNIDKRQTVYLSGPMTGLADFNRAAFDMRAEAFRAQGYMVLNPADLSRRAGTDRPYMFYLKRALRMMLEADVVYVFGTIRHSRGVQTELRVAREVNMPVVFEDEEGGAYDQETV